MNFFIGDVTGHGIASALIAGVLCGGVYGGEHRAGLLENKLRQEAEERLRDLAQATNTVIRLTGRQKKLATMAFLSLNLETGHLLYLNAAHCSPYLFNPRTGTMRMVPNRGSRLGYLPVGDFGVKEIKLDPGEIMFLYTDGLLENKGPEGQILRERELRSLIAQSTDVTALRDSLIERSEALWKGELQDDVTLLCVQWQHPVDADSFSKLASEFERHQVLRNSLELGGVP